MVAGVEIWEAVTLKVYHESFFGVMGQLCILVTMIVPQINTRDAFHRTNYTMGFLGGSMVENPPCQCRRCRRLEFNPWIRKIPWRRK